MVRQRPRHRLVFALILLGVLALILEGFAYAALGLLRADSRFDFTPIAERQRELVGKVEELLAAQGDGLLALDDELGWVYRPDYRGELYSSNALGMRGRRDYAESVPEGTLRIAAFGDSFVHANEVADDEAWSFQLEEIDPAVEVLNYGVGGYGTDQALLYYERRGEELDPSVVLLGFVEVDYARNVNRFRRFLSVHELPLFKPRFADPVEREGALELIPNPFPDAAAMETLLREPDRVRGASEGDWFFEPIEWSNPLYDRLASVRLFSTLWADVWRARLRPDGLYRDGVLNTDSEPYRVLVAIIDRFAELAAARGQAFVLVIFPGGDAQIFGDETPAYQPLLDRYVGVADGAEPPVRVLDLAPSLRNDPAVDATNLRRASGHYGPEANHTVARSIHALLADEGWLPGDSSAAQ